MLNKLGKKICAGVCALSLGLGSNVKSDALFWDVALIANEFLSGVFLTKCLSLESAKKLVELIKYLAKPEEEEEEDDDDDDDELVKKQKQEPKMVPVTWDKKLEEIKKETPGILLGVLGPILLVDAAQRSYELCKNGYGKKATDKKQIETPKSKNGK